MARAPTIAGVALLVLALVAWLGGRIRRLGDALAARGFVLAERPATRRTSSATWEPIARGTWRGHRASVKYTGSRTRWYTVVELEGRTREIEGYATDPDQVVAELDALLVPG